MNILFLSTYPIDKGPSQRFRIGIYLDRLRKEGHHVEYRPFYSPEAWEILYVKGKFIKKAMTLVPGYFGRWRLLLQLKKWDTIVIQREVSPLGPPIFAFLAAKVWRKRIIYDFDDAVWIPNFTAENATFHRLKAYWKTRYTMKWSEGVIAGNDYLADYARQYADKVVVIPTVVDTDSSHRSERDRSQQIGTPVIGWTGSISTIEHLKRLNSVLSQLQSKIPFKMRVIANKEPNLSDLEYTYIPWNRATEISELDKLDIGLMPLPNDPWSNGKCGFKAIQYMSMGIVAVVSPVGMNKQLIHQDVNGILCSTDEEWAEQLESLLKDAQKRIKLGENAVRTIEERYSLNSQLPALIKVLTNS